MSLPHESLDRLRRNYTPALLAHLAREDETTLRKGYELGRGAMAAGLSMLSLVAVHHQVLQDVVGTVRTVEEACKITGAAAGFLLEALAPYEMARTAVPRPSTGAPGAKAP